MREYPVKFLWYTHHKGKTIEWIIEHDPSYFIWLVAKFQNITPSQAQYYKNIHHREIRSEFIEDVEPYEWKKGDPEKLYMELCDTKDLPGTIAKYREKIIF